MSASSNALLKAAAEEFGSRGLKGVRIQEIVRNSGVNERMIYHHFGNKEGLYRATLAAEWEAFASAWKPALEEATQLSPVEGITHALTAYLHLKTSHPAFMRLVIQEALDGWNYSPPAELSKSVPELRSLFEAGVASEIFRPEVTFAAFYASAISALSWQTFASSRFTDLRHKSFAAIAGKQTIFLLVNGLRTRPNAKRTKVCDCCALDGRAVLLG